MDETGKDQSPKGQVNALWGSLNVLQKAYIIFNEIFSIHRKFEIVNITNTRIIMEREK